METIASLGIELTRINLRNFEMDFAEFATSPFCNTIGTEFPYRGQSGQRPVGTAGVSG
jgi:hypothetical protein